MYKLIDQNTIRRIEDGACIPTDPANTDYQIFLQWQADGGVPDPVPVEDPMIQRNAWAADIDSQAADIYAQYTKFKEEYVLREAAANAYKDAGYTGTVDPLISDYATSIGVDNKTATDNTLTIAAAYRSAVPILASLRTRKNVVLRAADQASAETEYNAVMAGMAQLVAGLP